MAVILAITNCFPTLRFGALELNGSNIASHYCESRQRNSMMQHLEMEKVSVEKYSNLLKAIGTLE